MSTYRAVILLPFMPQELKEELDIDVRVLSIASSSRMLLSEDGIDLSSWKDQFSQRVLLYLVCFRFQMHVHASFPQIAVHALRLVRECRSTVCAKIK